MLGIDEAAVPALLKSEALAGAGTPFPQPLGELELGPVWDRADVEEWILDRQTWAGAQTVVVVGRCGHPFALVSLGGLPQSEVFDLAQQHVLCPDCWVAKPS